MRSQIGGANPQRSAAAGARTTSYGAQRNASRSTAAPARPGPDLTVSRQPNEEQVRSRPLPPQGQTQQDGVTDKRFPPRGPDPVGNSNAPAGPSQPRTGMKVTQPLGNGTADGKPITVGGSGGVHAGKEQSRESLDTFKMGPHGGIRGDDPMRGGVQRNGSMYGKQGGSGSMYGKQGGSGSMYGKQGGSGSMYGKQGGSGSMYGKQGGSGSMYGKPGGSGSMYGKPGGSGSMYGKPGGSGSMYGKQGGSGSMYGKPGGSGSMYGKPGGSGSMYGKPGGSGSMYGKPGGMGSMYGVGGRIGSMYGMGRPGGMGSMYGMGRPGGMGSMYGMGRPGGMGSMYGMGRPGGMGSMYGMGRPGGMGSMYGMGRPGGMGSMYGMGRPGGMGSMYGMGRPGGMGSMYGMGRPGGMGSMYGMGRPGGMGSMYGMGRPGGMGSMYGMGGPAGMGSMYGMGGPAGMGSMYGMGGPAGMGSMYGMGGPAGMGSMYGMGGPAGMGSMYGARGSVPSVGDACDSTDAEKAVESTCGRRPSSEHAGRNDPYLREHVSCKLSAPLTAGTSSTNGKPSADNQKSAAGVNGKSALDVSGAAPDKVGPPRDAASASQCEKLKHDEQTMSNNNIRTVLVVGKTVGERVRADEVGKTVSMRCSDGKTVCYEADEVVCGDNVSVETSVQLRTIVRQVELGHNSALIVADSTAQQTISEGVTSSVMRSVMAVLRKNEREKGTKYEVFATAAEVPTATTARDLSSEGSAARPIRCGSNPMFGVCLMDMQERTLRSEDDAGLFARETLRKSSKASVLDIVHVTVKQVGRSADVYVSALVFLLVKGQGEYLRRLVAMDEGVVPTVLTKGVLGGNSCVAAVVGFSGSDVAVDTSILGSTAKLREIRNAPPRSGNLSRFVEFVTGQLSDCKAALERSKDGPERDRHERMLRKLEVMLADGKKLLSDPEGTRPRVYAPNKGPVVDGGAVKVGAAEKSESVKKGGPTNGTASAASPPKPKAEEAAAGAAGPWETPLKLVVTEGPKPPDNTIEIEVDGEKKVHRVDECIQRSGSRPVSSLVVQRMKEVLEKGCNVSLLSAEMVPGLAVDKHVTWNFAQEILRDTLNKKKDGVTRELALYMSILKGKQVVIDLFGGSEKLQLTVAKSPLFGVVVHGTSAKFVKDPTEVAPVFETALKRAKELLMGEEYIVCTAVLKQITGTDVIVSSLFVVSASDMQPYIDVIEKKPTHSQTLFAHPFLGPCSTAMLVSYQAMNDRVVKALNAHRKMALENSKAPGGSVRQFVGVMERSVASAEESLKKLGDSKERVHQERSLQDKKQALQDAKRLLENPNEAQPAAYAVPQAQECGGIDPTVRVVVILTEKRDGKKRCIMDKGSGFAVRTPAEEADFPADEVVKRLGQAATIRSSSVDFLIDHFVRGYNVALLTADGEGFSTGLPLLEHSARSVLGKIAPSSELFVMLASIKTDCASAKDLLHEGATYEPLQHASSPLFGPCVADAKLERIKTSDSLLRSLNDAVKVCEVDKTMFFSLFVHKERRASEGDVVLSSFLILLAGDNIDVYKSALEKRQKERGLLQYALGGPCLTAFTLGLTTATTDIDKPLAFGKLAKDAHGSRNGTIRTGGVRRFVAFSTKALEQLRALQKKAPESDRKRLMENATNVERVLADSEELLRNPCDRVPRAYKHEV